MNVVINEKDTLALIYWYNQELQGKPLIASGSVLKYRDQQEKRNQSGFF